MPAGIIPDEGIAATLQRILDPAGASPASWRLTLWVNDLVPDANTVLASLMEATFPGYSFVTLMPGAWTAADVVDGCGKSTYTTTPQTWFVTGPTTETIYGYALSDPGAGQLRFIQRFDDADIQPLVIGNRVVLLPRYSLTSAACAGDMLARRRKLPKRER